MKKNKLLKQILAIGLFKLSAIAGLYGQDTLLYYDRVVADLSLGVNHGFEILDLKNAGIATSFPMGINIKRYGYRSQKLISNPFHFTELSTRWVPMLVQKNFTSYARVDFKYGFVLTRSFVIVSIGPSYAFNLHGSFGNMYGGEITIKQNNVPISFMFSRNEKRGLNYFMIGISVQITRLRLRRGDAFGY